MLINDVLNLQHARYVREQRPSAKTFLSQVKAIRSHVGHLSVSEVKAEDFDDFIESALDSGRSPATINRALEYLRAATNYCVRLSKLPPKTELPFVTLPNADKVRQGFVDAPQMRLILAEFVDPYFRDFIEFQMLSGWRVGATLSLTFQDLTWDAGGESGLVTPQQGPRNKPRGVLELRGRVREIMIAAWNHPNRPRAADWREQKVFRRKTGRPIKKYRPTWNRAVERVGLQGLLLHDMRRSVSRLADAAGISRPVVMRMMGHRTMSHYLRYRIVDRTEIGSAAERIGWTKMAESKKSLKRRSKPQSDAM